MRRSALGLIAAAALFAGLAAAPAAAAPESYAFDKSHTSIFFLADHLGFSTVPGRFGEYDGSITYDPENPGAAKLELTIRTASLDTFFARRDEHLRSPDFFNVLEFPEASFVATGFEKTGEKTGRMDGDLTLLGVTRPVSLDLILNKRAESPLSGKMVLGVTARGTIRRSAFGMTYGLPGVADEVDLWIEAEAVRQ